MINASYNQRKHAFITDLEILLLSNVKFGFNNNPTMTNNDDHHTMASTWRYSTTTYLTIK